MSTRSFLYFKYFIYAILFLILVHFGTSLFSKEGFANISPQEMTDEQEITAFMTTASEYICPTYDTVLEESMKEYTGTDEEKRQLAIQKLTKDAQGALFPCPPPNDPLAVPADIDERIKRTLTYFNTQISSMNKKIESSLGCPPSSGFEDFIEPFATANVCREEDLQIREKHLAEEASISAATRCVASRDLEATQRKEILTARKTALVRVMTDKAISQALAKLKGETQELKEFKRSLMEGKVMSNCPT
jgi:hypothetical protein